MRRHLRVWLSQGGGGGGTGGTPPAATPPANTPPADDPPADDPNNGGGVGNENDAAWLKAELAKVRREAAAHRTKANALEAAEQQRKQSEMTELQKAQAEAERLKTERESAISEARQARAEVAISRAAVAAGIKPELAIRLVTPEFDNNGQPTGIAEAVAALATAHPELVTSGATTPTGGTPTNAPRTRPANAVRFTREQLKDPKFFAENQAAIMQAMKDGRIDD